MRIWETLEEQARRRPNALALVGGDRERTYACLARDVARLASGLSGSGLVPGDRLAVHLPGNVECVTTLLAAACAELIAVPVLPDYREAHRDEILRQAAPAAVVTSERGAFPVARTIRCGEARPGGESYEGLLASGGDDGLERRSREDDPIWLLADTSGSTGRIKLVAHSQARLLDRAGRFAEALALGEDDVALPLFHPARPVQLVCGVLAMLRTGGTAVLLERPDVELFWAAYRERRPTYVLSPPSATRSFLAHPEAGRADHARVRFWAGGGERVGAPVAPAMTRATGRPYLNMYGATEGGLLAMTRPGDPVKEGSVGRPMEGLEVRITGAGGDPVPDGEAGELWVRSASLMVGYWNDTLATHRAIGSGWLRTGDLFRRDADGDLWFEGRVDQLAVPGAGPATAPVVEALLAFPGVVEALATVAGEKGAERLTVFYHLGPSVTDPGAGVLGAWISERVATRPARLQLVAVDRWPLTPTGKVDRRALLARADERAR